MYMNTTETEKDWLRRICGQKPSDTAEKQVRKVAKEAVEQNPTPLKKKGNGFGDVAGMNELKQRRTLLPCSSLMSLMLWCHDVRVRKATYIMTAG